MSDIREGRDATASDPYAETLSDPASRIKPAEPEGSTLTLNDDGSMTIVDEPNKSEDAAEDDHAENLAEFLSPERLTAIAMDYLDMVDIDIEAHKKSDKHYEDALRRTGLGDDAPGGAPFSGASRAVHPMLTEAIVDYSARVVRELLPAGGPVKSAVVVGKYTNDKTSQGDRVARYMNWQLTQQMQSAYNEIEVGLPQEALSGAFYTKMVVGDGKPALEVVFSDKVHRPWGDGDFYTQNRITHEMLVDKHTFRDNVESGLWLDALNPETSHDMLELTDAETANDRIIGQNQPIQNIDENRTVYEISTRMALDPESDIEEDTKVLPYLLTIDEQTQKVLAIYRNWKEGDPNYFRLDFLIEWPFIPWRGGYPIGFGRMIGGLSGAASGALRALLDAAFLNCMQTGVKLKGGTTVGGQNIRVNPAQTTEVQGSLAQDPDIRKTYMPLPFPEPNTVLFQLLGFLVDAGKGVVRTTFDEFNKMNGEMPVGTANMMIEQGLTTFGSIYGRQHRALRRFLNQLWYINQHTVEDEQIVDDFGELVVTKDDFKGPMTVVPVSDPNIFTDAQRMAGAQLVANRAQVYTTAGIPLYKAREVELFLMRNAKVPDPEQFLSDAPEPTQMTAASENVAAAMGLPIKAYPGQDHEAHLAQHSAFIDSPIFGSNQIVAMKLLPPLIAHLGEHLALWYDNAMKLSMNEVLRQKLHDPRITVDALETVSGLEVQLDRLMAILTPAVMNHAKQELSPILQTIQKAQALLKQLQPPQPMDPSIVAMKDVERQTEADKAKAAKDQADLQHKSQDSQQKNALAAKDQADTTELKQAELQHKDGIAQGELQQKSEEAERKAVVDQSNADAEAEAGMVNAHVAIHGQQTQAATAADAEGSKQAIAAHTTAADLQQTREDNAVKLEIADKNNEAKVAAAKAKPKPKPAK
jgi:hypothetical protein